MRIQLGLTKINQYNSGLAGLNGDPTRINQGQPRK